MNISDYQSLARRTQNKELNPAARLHHALFGICGEAGEIQSLYQKTYQGHQLDEYQVADELGDLLWFAAELCDVYGWDMADVCAHNISKLRSRYPEGFDSERSLHREGESHA